LKKTNEVSKKHGKTLSPVNGVFVPFDTPIGSRVLVATQGRRKLYGEYLGLDEFGRQKALVGCKY